jgi:hypothetical protein
MINTIKGDPLPMNVRGYLYPVKNIEVEGEVASATAFRNAIKNSPDKESAKEVFSKQFKDYNEQVFNLVYNKLAGEKMSEDLNILRQLAGLELSEGGPIEFEDQVSVKDVEFAEPSKSSSKLSIANRFPEGSDINNPEDKKEMYVKELLKSPVALLSEINERIMPDENGLAVSSKLNKILDGMRDGGIADLEPQDKGFVIDLVKHSLKNMELEAGDDREFDPESGALESIDLDDIRSDYDVEKGKLKEEESLEEKLKSIIRMYEYQIEEYEKNAKEFVKDHGELDDSEEKQDIFMDYVMDVNLEDTEDKLEAFKEALHDHQNHGTTHWWQSEIGGELDTAVRDEIAMYLKEIGAWKGDLEEAVEEDEMDSFKGSTKDGHKYRAVADDQGASQYLKVFYGDGKFFRIYYDSNVGRYAPGQVAPETNDPKAEEVFANLPDDFFKKYGSEGETGLEDIIDMIKKGDLEEAVEEGKVKDMAMDQADEFYNKVSDIADKSNDIQKAIIDAWKDEEENPPVWALDDGAKDILIDAGLIDAEPEEPEMEESLDPLSEPSKEEYEYERLMTAKQKGEEELAKELGISIEQLGDEIDEYGRDHGLHSDDDRDEILNGYIEDLVHNADYKDHGEQDFDPKDMEMMDSIEELKKLAGINEEKCPNCGKKKHILKACSSCGCS